MKSDGSRCAFSSPLTTHSSLHYCKRPAATESRRAVCNSPRPTPFGRPDRPRPENSVRSTEELARDSRRKAIRDNELRGAPLRSQAGLPEFLRL